MLGTDKPSSNASQYVTRRGPRFYRFSGQAMLSPIARTEHPVLAATRHRPLCACASFHNLAPAPAPSLRAAVTAPPDFRFRVCRESASGGVT